MFISALTQRENWVVDPSDVNYMTYDKVGQYVGVKAHMNLVNDYSGIGENHDRKCPTPKCAN